MGDVLGRYVLEAVLGEGGMGVVFRAHDPQLDRRVALKVMKAPATGLLSTDAKARLLREARAVAALSHVGIVTIFDIGEIDGLPFLAMELVDGHSLRSIESGRPSIPVDQALAWLGGLAEALAAAHRAGIIHRDVKPENVMIRADGQVKLLDLGIARSAPVVGAGRASSSSSLPTLTDDNVLVGTAAYMSPEQIRSQPLDGRTDQFSWGVLAYELLARRLPWSGATDSIALVASIVTEQPAALSVVAPRVPPEAAAVVARALSKDKASRFESMDQLLDAWPLARAARHAVSVAPPPLSEKSRAGFVSAPTEAVSTTASRPAPPAPPRRRRVRAPAVVLVAVASLAAALLVRRPWRDVATKLPAGVSATPESSRVLVNAPAQSPARADGSPTVTRLHDHPRPASAVPAALEAFERGVREEEDAVNASFRSYQRAVELDADLAAAYVRLTVYSVGVVGADDEANARKNYRAAIDRRERLSERDRALLDALAPVVVEEPKDWGAAESRVRRLVSADPGDLDLQVLLATVLAVRERFDDELVVTSHLLALDPGNTQASMAESSLHLDRGDYAKARVVAQGCVDRNPRATACLFQVESTEQFEGRCAAAEHVAQRMVQFAPDDVWGYIRLFETEAAQRVPLAALEVTSSRLVAHAPADSRAWAAIRYPWLIAVWRGDFARATHLLDDEMALAVRLDDVDDQLYVERDRAELAFEVGDVARAGVAAEAYLARRRVAPAPSSPNRDSLLSDATPRVLEALRRTGRLAPAAAAARRDEWLAAWTSRVTPSMAPRVWLEGYARAASTWADAEAALARLPPTKALERLGRGGALESEAIGRVYLLAGKPDLAVPYLARAASSCEYRRFPFQIPRAMLELGQAREATGDVKGACEAFARVLAAWGDATPRSVTADAARARAAMLGCAGTNAAPGDAEVRSTLQ